MKKILTILLIGLACFSLTACNNEEKENNEEIKKGDGSNWYLEPPTTGNTYKGLIHSTFDCPTVKNGVIPNAWLSGKKSSHSFCTKCMNEELIEKWYEWFDENEANKK